MNDLFNALYKLSKSPMVGKLVFWIGYLYLGMWNHIFNKIPLFSIRHFVLRYFYGLHLGESSLHMGIVFFSPWKISIGSNSIIHFDAFLDGRGGVEIGDNVDISFGVKIFTEQHLMDSPLYETEAKRVMIGDYAVIGAYSTLLPGVTVGEGAVIATGSVVTKDVAPYSVVGGVPARFIKMRQCIPQYQLRFQRPFH